MEAHIGIQFWCLTQTLSSWHTVLLTFDRYIAVCYPFQYHKIMAPKIQKILIIVVWMISIFENLCPELYIKAFKCEDNIQKRPRNFRTSLQLSHLTVIFTLHFIMYSRIWWIAHKMRQRSVEAFSDNPPLKRWILDKATTTVFYVVVLSCYLVAIYDDSVNSTVFLFGGFLCETYNFSCF